MILRNYKFLVSHQKCVHNGSWGSAGSLINESPFLPDHYRLSNAYAKREGHAQLLPPIATLEIRVLEHTNIYLYSTFAVEASVSFCVVLLFSCCFPTDNQQMIFL